MSFRILPVCSCTAHDGDHVHIPGTKARAEPPLWDVKPLPLTPDVSDWLAEVESKIREKMSKGEDAFGRSLAADRTWRLAIAHRR